MAISNLNITFHNPNTVEETTKFLSQVFAEVSLRRVEEKMKVHIAIVQKESPAV